MTTAGFVSMALSLVFVVSLVGWCYYRVLTAPEQPPEQSKDFHSA
jgi:hypothetical protein